MIKLIRLLPDQTAKFWPVLSKGFLRSLPPGVIPNEIVVNNLLAGIMRRHYDCWLIKGDRDGESRQIAAAITHVCIEPITGVRTLMIYSLYAKTMLSSDEWREVFRLASEVARKHKCSRLSGYTQNESIEAIVKELGGNTDMRVVELAL